MPLKRTSEVLNAEDDEPTIQCDGIGPPIQYDPDTQRTFYTACKTDDLTFAVGDCVRVKLGEENEDMDASAAATYAYAQVLAIYEEQDEVFAEVRWFQQHHDLPKKVQKR
ncbi:MAG: hypothetical protein EOO38_23635 [Cytophagaceae bacterium]|nr:MAG: hypothetical protein EOO38_23635 [Cytophagaceae bacterium]